MKLAQIVKDPDIYPRVQVSHKTIGSYVEALKARAKFPAILVQSISSDGKVETISLDGWHRIEAYREYNKLDGVKPIEEIKVTHWKDEVLDKKEWLERLRIVSARHNLIHGDRLSEKDLESQGLKIVNDRSIDKLVGIERELAGEWGKTEGYISQLIGDEVNRKKQSRNALAYSLHLLGWTQSEIGEVTGEKSQGGVSQIIKKFNIKLFNSEYESGLTPEQIATNHNLTQALVWALLLEGKDDIERFKLFGKSEYGDAQPRLDDYWKFNQRDPRLGVASYPGNLYGQEVLNILYRYTKQGDLVVDPMAGGGTTVDACLIMGRRCRAYDDGGFDRRDIAQHDIRRGFPDRAKDCNLIILDPPYYKKKETAYGSEFTKDRGTFMNNMARLAEESYKVLHPGGCVALLYGQFINYENELDSILSSDLCRMFEEENFRCILRIQSPLTFNNQYADFDVERAKSFTPWRILPVSKDWQIFKKVII